ncbi:hypothetical protein BGW38_007706, partial [Lunasporangiospora selenospora]
MGIQGLWPFLRKRGYRAKIHNSPPQPSSSHSKIRVDVNSTFFPTINYAYSQNSNDQDAAHRILEDCIAQLGSKSDIILYVDGDQSLEKQKTQNHREATRQKSINQARQSILGLEQRLATRKRIRKHHIRRVWRLLKRAFYWQHQDRLTFIEYMTSKGWEIQLCPMEADISIAAECQPHDIVISRDSDLLVFRRIRQLWRPMGPSRRMWFLTYAKDDICSELEFTDQQLTALGIVCKNDYSPNIPMVGIEKSYKIIKAIDGDKDIEAMIAAYLSDDRVQFRNAAREEFANAIRVFAKLTQTPVRSTGPLPDNNDTTVTLRERMIGFLDKLMEQKRADRDARRKSRKERGPRQQFAQKYWHFRTIDVPDNTMSHNFRKRYSCKEQYESGIEHPPPEVMSEYKWRPPKKHANQSDPKEPEKLVEKERPKVRKRIHGVQKGRLLRELEWEHPTVTLDMGTLRANVSKVSSEDSSAELIISCVERAVREASKVKRKCQEILGRYLKAISDSEVTKEDRVILEYLCPHDDDGDDTVDCANNGD